MVLKVPEYIDLKILGTDIALELQNKIQGDFHVKCSSGSVSIDKLRGKKLEFNCGAANVTVAKLLEGDVSLRANALVAKMVNGDDVHIHVDTSAKVEAMYAKFSRILACTGLQINNFHGHLNAQSITKDISVNGLVRIVLDHYDRYGWSVEKSRLSRK